MRKSFVILAVILQLIVLAYMAGEREYILRNGKVIHLRTAPIDPRDMFRGDYVRLNYEISRIPVSRLKGVDSVGQLKKGDKIFVSLEEGPNGLYELVDAGLERPENGIYLAGRLPYPYRTLRTSNPIWINYGIEAYFVEQGRGRVIEKAPRKLDRRPDPAGNGNRRQPGRQVRHKGVSLEPAGNRHPGCTKPAGKRSRGSPQKRHRSADPGQCFRQTLGNCQFAGLLLF
jgi:uncharacterized membrane-anchored protein